MLINNFARKNSKLLKNFMNIKNKQFSATFLEDEEEEEMKFKDKEGREKYEEWKRKIKEDQESQMRRAQEMVRRRKEESKRGNKEFLLKMKIPGVKEEPEK